MCGRFALGLTRGEIRRLPGHDDIVVDEWIDEDAFIPRYNIAPRTHAPILARLPSKTAEDRSTDNSSSMDARYVLRTMKWGLVPHWSKFEDKSLSTTNARAENLVEGGGMWASLKGKRRGVVLCQGYYEWMTKGKDKLPHFIKHDDGKLMLLAGLYDSVVLEGQTTPLWTFTIVTTAASNNFSWLHDRQPVILSSHADLETWLNTSTQSWAPELSKLVMSCHNTTKNPLKCYQVVRDVGKVGLESPRFIEPIADRKDGIQAMFSKQASRAQPSSAGSLPPSSPKLLEPKSDSAAFRPSKRIKRSYKAPDELLEILDKPTVSEISEASQDLSQEKSSKPREKFGVTKKKAHKAQTKKLTSFFSKA